MAKRGWRTSLFYLLLVLAAIVGPFLGQRVSPLLAYSFALGLAAAAIFLHRKGAGYLEDSQILQLKQKRLEAKAWYFESVITNSGNIIFTTDVDHRVLKFNRGSERTFGISQTDVLGKEVYALFDNPADVKALLAKVDIHGTAEAGELKARQVDTGEDLWLSMSATRMFNRDKEVIGEVFNCSNITKRKQLETQLQEKNDQLLRLSITDGLTGLYNLRHLNSELGKLIRAQKRFPNRPVSVVLIDVDKFKEYNDTKGHQAGDHLLVMLANIFNTELRLDLDSAYRYGGDEFVLVLPDTNGEGARVICDRILNAFRKLRLHPTSLSIGVAQWTPHDDSKDMPQAVKDFISKADESMYTVKIKGGDSINIRGR